MGDRYSYIHTKQEVLYLSMIATVYKENIIKFNNNNPLLLSSIPYCLTIGVQFSAFLGDFSNFTRRGDALFLHFCLFFRLEENMVDTAFLQCYN